MDNKPTLLQNVIGADDAKIVASIAGHDVSDIYIAEPTLLDLTNIIIAEKDTPEIIIEQMGVIACLKNSSGTKVLTTDMEDSLPAVVGIRLRNIVSTYIIKLNSDANKKLGDDMGKLGIERSIPKQPSELKKNSNSPSAKS